MSALVAIVLAASAITQTAVDTTRFVTSKDGTRIAYDVSGSGPVIILLHGGGQTRQAWHGAGYVTRLSKEFTVVSLDIRGNGESGKPSAVPAYHIDRIKEDILAVADAVKADRFTLWGFSYGANLGRYLAASSDRVRAMVYIGIPFGPAAGGIFRQRILEMPEAKRPAWLAAMLDYPAIEPAEMRSPTLWVVGTANEFAMTSVKEYEPKLAGTRVKLALVDGLTHPLELSSIDRVYPQEVEFTRATAR